MNRNVSEIRKMFNRRVQEASRTSFYGVVSSVDRQMRTCAVQVGQIAYRDVLLYAVVNPLEKGYTVFPEIGSTVLLTRIEGSERLFVAMFSQVNAVELTIGDQYLCQADSQGLQIKHGENVCLSMDETGVVISNQAGIVHVTAEEVSAKVDDTEISLTVDHCKIGKPGTTLVMNGNTIELAGPGASISIGEGLSFSCPSGELLSVLENLCQTLALLQVTTEMGLGEVVSTDAAKFTAMAKQIESFKSK